MKKALCKKSYANFKRGECYVVNSVHSIFVDGDYITMADNKGKLYRFILRDTSVVVDDYLGEGEVSFKYYFYTPEETLNMNRNKLIERMLK